MRISRIGSIAFAAIALLAVGPPLARAADYRVSPETCAKFELDTLPKLAPGDHVWFTDGLYPRTAEFRISKSGTADSKIVFEAEHPGMAFFQGPPITGPYPDQTKLWYGINIRGSDIVVRGLKIARAPFNGITIAGSRCLIELCDVSECGFGKADKTSGGEGILVSGSAVDTVIRKTKCYKDREHGAYLTRSKQTTVEDCDLYENQSCGLEANGAGPDPGSYRHHIINCRLYGNQKRGMNLLILRDSVIEGCQFYGNASYAITISQGSTGNTFRNNQFATNTRACFYFNQGGNFGLTKGNTLTGNTFYLLKTSPAVKDIDGDPSQNTIGPDNKTTDLTPLMGIHPKIVDWLDGLLNKTVAVPTTTPDDPSVADPADAGP